MPDSPFPTAEPFSFNRSWPLRERARQFYLGCVIDRELEADSLAEDSVLGHHASGWWECALPDDRLSWSPGIYDLFGLPRGAAVTRGEAVGFYAEHSRAAMERLRSHAIRYRCGFTLDAEIRPVSGGTRWMRLIGAPICDGERVVALHGLKLML
jgi:PAS domain-containing protein